MTDGMQTLLRLASMELKGVYDEMPLPGGVMHDYCKSVCLRVGAGLEYFGDTLRDAREVEEAMRWARAELMFALEIVRHKAVRDAMEHACAWLAPMADDEGWSVGPEDPF